MKCEKLPETKEEMTAQLKKSLGNFDKKDVALFWIGVSKTGQMHEQKVGKEYLQKMTPIVLEIANSL